MTNTLGLVAAPHYLAAEIGADILQNGGNAFDAAVAVALAIGVTQPYHSGIGGGCNSTFMMSDGSAGHINARGPAPQQLARSRLLDADGNPIYDLAQRGGLAVTIPSFVAGLYALHQGRGKLSWSDVCLAPQTLAADGFTADFMMASVYRQTHTANKVAEFAQGTTFPAPIHQGQRVIQPQMAETLGVIAKDYRAVYEGEIAQHLTAAAQKFGGVLIVDDLATYQPQPKSVIEVSYRGWRILANGLPTIGSLQTLFALQILSNLSLDAHIPGSTEHLHLIAEAVKAAYAVRAEVDTDSAESIMTDAALAERIASEIRLDSIRATLFEATEGGNEALLEAVPNPESHTSHFCVADGDGNVVSQTQTVRSIFGSGVIDPVTGVVLNDSVGDFSLRPGEVTTQGIRYQGEYNLLVPGAEPASSQSPLIAIHPETGDIIAAGAAGGPRIVSATVQSLVNQIDFGMDARLASAFPRIHSHGMATDLEPNSTAGSGLSVLGHTIEETARIGIMQTIRRQDGKWMGAADMRGPGGAVMLIESDGYVARQSYGYRIV
ncbi:MAG: gamma-glutamyltransferase [Chloroflexota bacterium]